MKLEIDKTDFESSLISNLSEFTDLLSDMGILFLESEENSFLSSDNPAATYNILSENIRYENSRGLARPGVICHVPITDKIAIFLYDKQRYEVKGVNGKYIKVNKDDVRVLNMLVATNASQCLYFKNGMDDYAKRIINSVKDFRENHNAVYVESELEGDSSRRLVHMYEEFPNMHMQLSFIKVPKKVFDNKAKLPRERSQKYVAPPSTNRRSDGVQLFRPIKTVKVKV